MIGVSFIYTLLAALLIGGYAGSYLMQKFKLKGLLIGILIFIVLVPLVFWGTCLLNSSGSSLKSLFLKWQNNGRLN
jgi:uncharacterized membrane protein